MMKQKRNAPCWCGSGKKFKHCHLHRESQSPVLSSEILKARKKAFGKKYCLHPHASKEICQGKIIKAHTIQRNGGLSQIADNGHVYTHLLHHQGIAPSPDPDGTPNNIGIGVASTFTGFCSFHDNQLFEPLEKHEFLSSPEQIFLLQYRSLCQELFLKTSALELTKSQRPFDGGLSPDRQLDYQESLNLYEIGVLQSIKELQAVKEQHDSLLLSEDYTSLRYYVILLDRTPDILCSAVHQPEFDFSGKRLQELSDLSQDMDWVHYSLIATDRGGAAIFSWLGDRGIGCQLVKTLEQQLDISQALVRYIFEFFENVYFSPKWWNDLPTNTKRNLRMRQFRGLISEWERLPDCLMDDGINSVKWRVINKINKITNVNF